MQACAQMLSFAKHQRAPHAAAVHYSPGCICFVICMVGPLLQVQLLTLAYVFAPEAVPIVSRMGVKPIEAAQIMVQVCWDNALRLLSARQP